MKTISGKKLCKIIERSGWNLKRINGSHHVYKKEGKEELIVIPVHKNQELKAGLLKSILRIAEIDESEI